jgi:hypothetical protein
MAEPGELLTMSAKEIDRVEIVQRVLSGGLTRVKAGEILGISARHVHRLCKAYEAAGPVGLISRRRGRPSNRQLPDHLRAAALELIRQRYAD